MNEKSQEMIGGKRYPDFREPLKQAWAWVREKKPDLLQKAVDLLRELKAEPCYPHVLQIRYELALALLTQNHRDEAKRELEAAGREFTTLDEDTHSLWGRCFKEDGDSALARQLDSEALHQYGLAEERYEKAYALRHDRFPGINVATLRLIRASIAHRLGQTELSRSLRQTSQKMAEEVVAARSHWVSRLGDDKIWMFATEAEARLLLGDWNAAERLYAEAKQHQGCKEFHRNSMCDQVARLVEAYQRLGEKTPGPLADPKTFFSPTPPTSPIT